MTHAYTHAAKPCNTVAVQCNAVPESSSAVDERCRQLKASLKHALPGLTVTCGYHAWWQLQLEHMHSSIQCWSNKGAKRPTSQQLAPVLHTQKQRPGSSVPRHRLVAGAPSCRLHRLSTWKHILQQCCARGAGAATYTSGCQKGKDPATARTQG